ncbi:hypothetical protein CKA32_000106 [Geitlerinema sp. FC II]|nr:hypothetical protein CKA32_000106 [Geitlerinema sp. FC II]
MAWRRFKGGSTNPESPCQLAGENVNQAPTGWKPSQDMTGDSNVPLRAQDLLTHRAQFAVR